MWCLAEFGVAKPGESGIPMDVGFFGFICQSSEAGGAADFLAVAGYLGFDVREWAGGRRWHWLGGNPNDFTSDGPVIGFERAGGIGESAPVNRGGPGQVKDVAGIPCDGADGLTELPSLQVWLATEVLEKCHGRLRCVGIGNRIGPFSRPADEVWPGAFGDIALEDEPGEVGLGIGDRCAHENIFSQIGGIGKENVLMNSIRGTVFSFGHDGGRFFGFI